jgi:hypothetical protein
MWTPIETCTLSELTDFQGEGSCEMSYCIPLKFVKFTKARILKCECISFYLSSTFSGRKHGQREKSALWGISVAPLIRLDPDQSWQRKK